MRNSEKKTFSFKSINVKYVFLLIVLLLVLVSLSTKYYGYIDIKDYTDTAKFFAGDYSAKLRTAHSVMYGLIHTPFVKLTQNFIFFKLSSVLWLALIILSLYYISNKNKKTFLLFILSPILWYMAPWVNSIQLSSLLFLWTYYFIKKYDESEKLKYLFFSGALVGLSWVFWDAIVYFSIILALCFLYNKKAFHFAYFLAALFIGALPRIIVDQLMFGFAFYSFLKHFFALSSFALYGGIYGQVQESIFHTSNIFAVLIILPFFIYTVYNKSIWLKNKKTILFLTFSLLLIIFNNSEIRYLLIVYPIILLLLGDSLTKRQFKIQAIIFLIVSLIIINSYIIQTKYETNFADFNYLVKNFPNYKINSQFSNDLIKQDINLIATQYPNQFFIVGNGIDDYSILADLYWGNQVKEFVSIQDYRLFLKNESIIAGKTICSKSKSWNRRDICFSVALTKTLQDDTDYNSINYAISFDKNLSLENFKLIKEYSTLSFFEKSS